MKQRFLLLSMLFLSAVSFANELPQLMLLENYTHQNVQGWVMSEKLDGVRGYWDGKQLFTRQNKILMPPHYFTKGFPPFAVDGELFSERNQFEFISSVVRSQKDKGWEKLKLYVFDVPHAQGNLFQRLAVLEKFLLENPTPYIEVITQIPIQDKQQVKVFLQQVEEMQGEGLVLRNPNAPYQSGRNSQILKLKTILDEECTVIEHHQGKGQYENKLGAITCENHRGKFKIGSGFSLEERIHPIPIGAVITYKYRGLTKNGLPRFATYWREKK